MFGYLSEFWSQIVEVTISAGVYTVDWFQSVGNAVAGAMGRVFVDPLKLIVDFFLAIGYILTALFSIVTMIFGLLKFLTTLIVNVAVVLVITPISQPLFTLDPQSLVFIKAYPQISTLLFVLGVLVIFIGVFKIIQGLGKALT